MSDRFAGAIGLASMTVKHADTAIALGSGDVAVLGTPRLVGLAEEATIAAFADHEPGVSTPPPEHQSTSLD